MRSCISVRHRAVGGALVLLVLTVLPLHSADQDRIQKLEKLVAVLDAQVKDKDDQLADKKKLISALEEDKKDLSSVNQKQGEKIAELQRQMGAQEEIQRLLRENVEVHKKMWESCEQGIKDRDAVIKELAKSVKGSALKKIAESIPVVAGIIAVAIASN